MGPCPSLGYEPHNIECFTGEEVETEDGHAELKKPEQDKQKSRQEAGPNKSCYSKERTTTHFYKC